MQQNLAFTKLGNWAKVRIRELGGPLRLGLYLTQGQ